MTQSIITEAANACVKEICKLIDQLQVLVTSISCNF
jgi:hypothetical protein